MVTGRLPWAAQLCASGVLKKDGRAREKPGIKVAAKMTGTD